MTYNGYMDSENFSVRIAVDRTIEALATRPEDSGAIRLARYYADTIDECSQSDDPKISAWAARWICPLLLDCLTELGATPAARAKLLKGEPARAGTTRLTALRSRR